LKALFFVEGPDIASDTCFDLIRAQLFSGGAFNPVDVIGATMAAAAAMFRIECGWCRSNRRHSSLRGLYADSARGLDVCSVSAQIVDFDRTIGKSNGSRLARLATMMPRSGRSFATRAMLGKISCISTQKGLPPNRNDIAS